MELKDTKNIAVVGAGTMGSGIAQACAQGGYRVWMQDLMVYEPKTVPLQDLNG